MSAIQLREGVWSVGVLNPALRVFDIVMESRYGTSYNAYLVTGGEKTALIEAVHKDYFEDLVSNIEEILPVEKLDYLIMNHTEPDHSGGVRALLDRCPNLTVLCSSSAKKFLTSIANEEFPCRVVKDGDTLDLGGKTLRFISAPLLHWPDSIFTWDEADKTLFTCDFLGCHFCEPSMRDTGIHPEYRRYYEAELLNYFNCIFGPFKPAVLDGLDKMPAGVELVCTSHGPTLSQSIGYVKDCYRQWAAPAVRPDGKKTVGIIYCSAYGCTRALADAAAKALTADGMQVTTLDVVFAAPETVSALVNACDVVLFGTPTINRNAPEAIWNAVHGVDAINTRGGPPALSAPSAGPARPPAWSRSSSSNSSSRLWRPLSRSASRPLRPTSPPWRSGPAGWQTWSKLRSRSSPRRRSTSASSAAIFTIPRRATRTGAWPPAPPLKICRSCGPAPCAAWTRPCSSPWTEGTPLPGMGRLS